MLASAFCALAPPPPDRRDDDAGWHRLDSLATTLVDVAPAIKLRVRAV